MSDHQEDFDFEKFIDLMDTAINSTDPRVKNCLSNLLLMTSFVHATENSTMSAKPFRRMLTELNSLKAQLSAVITEVTQIKTALNRPLLYPNTTNGTGAGGFGLSPVSPYTTNTTLTTLDLQKILNSGTVPSITPIMPNGSSATGFTGTV